MTFTLAIRHFRHGWADISLTFGPENLEFSASAVANDPLEELAELGVALLTGGSLPRQATFWLEPEGYDLLAWSQDGATWLALRYAECAFARLWEPIETRAKAVVTKRAVAHELHRALEACKDAVQLVNGTPHWCYPYPEALTAKLGAELQSYARH